jgi:hypothetical protein
LGVVLFVGAVIAWQHLHPKPEPRGKKNKEKPFYGPSPFNFPPTDH